MSIIYVYERKHEFSTDPYLSPNSLIPSIIENLEISRSHYRRKIEPFLQSLRGIHYASKTPPFSRTLFSIGQENGEKADISEIDDFFNGESIQLIIPIQDYKSKKLEREIKNRINNPPNKKDYDIEAVERKYTIQTGKIELTKGNSGIERRVEIYNPKKNICKDITYTPNEAFIRRLANL